MKINEVRKIEKDGPRKNVSFEVEYEDNDGNKKSCLCEGEEWLEEEDGQPKFIKRIKEEESREAVPEEEVQDKKITRLNKFKDMVIK